MANPTIVKLIMNNWIEKSESEKQPFNKYIALWIAFNAYYSSATNENFEKDSITKIKCQSELKQYYLSIANSEEITNLLSVSPIINMKNNKAVIINGKEDYSSIIETLYQIRNNLFHGSKTDHIERDEEVVTAALPILKKIVIYCQKHFDEIEF